MTSGPMPSPPRRAIFFFGSVTSRLSLSRGARSIGTYSSLCACATGPYVTCAAVRVDAELERADRPSPPSIDALVGDRDGVADRRVGERPRARVRHRARHVGARSSAPRRGPRRSGGRAWSGRHGRDAAALIDRDVDDRRCRAPSSAMSSSVTSCGALAPGHEHRADHEVRALDHASRCSRRWSTASRSRRRTRPPGSSWSRRARRARSPARPCRSAIVAALRPTTPPPRITTRPRRVPGTPPSEHALAAALLLQARRADLHGHAARDLAHRPEQRQRPVGELDRLVGDARHLALRELARELRLGARGAGTCRARGPRGSSRTRACSGSFTFTTMLGAPRVGRGVHDRARPRGRTARREMPLPSPAPVSTMHLVAVRDAARGRPPASCRRGTRAILISFGDSDEHDFDSLGVGLFGRPRSSAGEGADHSRRQERDGGGRGGPSPRRDAARDRAALLTVRVMVNERSRPMLGACLSRRAISIRSIAGRQNPSPLPGASGKEGLGKFSGVVHRGVCARSIEARVPPLGSLAGGRRHDRVRHRHRAAALRLRELQTAEGRHHARDHARIRQIRAAVRRAHHAAVAADRRTARPTRPARFGLLRRPFS